MAKSDRVTALVSGIPVTGDPLAGVSGDARYVGFFHCFNAGDYYEAHDVLEHLWLETRGEDHAFFKGLIQVAGAFVHLRKQFEQPGHPHHGRRARPAARLFRSAAGYLAPFAPVRHRLDVAAVVRLCETHAAIIEDAGFASNPWSPEARPVMCLMGGAG
jgi:hypothetical protein